MKINLKNYTTKVAALKSIDLIEKLLINFGATHISKEYQDGKCYRLAFILKIDDIPVPFRLPGNVAQVTDWLHQKKKTSAAKTVRDQAERIAWKNQYELLYLQLGMIEEKQLEPLQVLLSFLYDIEENKTFYEKIKANGIYALLPASRQQQ